MFNVARFPPKAGIPTAFQDGKACFSLDTSYFIAALIRTNVPFKWGVTPTPELKSYPLSIFREELNAWGHPRPPSPNFAQYDTGVSDALRELDDAARIDGVAAATVPLIILFLQRCFIRGITMTGVKG